MNAASRQIVVMGVSGSGKTTIAKLLAEALPAEFLEGDALHPPSNVARMAAGIPLTDDDRRGWLEAIGGELATAHREGRSLIASCSALKRSYRDLLRASGAPLLFVQLHAARAVLEARLIRRTAHFMPPSLLSSQLQTLEAPTADEHAITLDSALPEPEIVERARAWIAAQP